MKQLFKNIGVLYGLSDSLKFGKQMSEMSSLKDAYILVKDGNIEAVGVQSDLPQEFDGEIVDLMNAEVMPGLVDSHTHTVFAASREEEFVMRIKGATYEEIAEAGGGILNSARKLRLASEEMLYEQAYARVIDMIKLGTTTLEIKSGYGLSVEGELKMLRVIKKLKETLPITIKATFLGAHAFPEVYRERKDDYVNLIVRDMLPIIAAEELADHVDAFCEVGFFSPQQTHEVLTAARAYGIPSKIHGNQLGRSGGVEVAVNTESWSVDHLEYTDNTDWALLLKSFEKAYGGTIPVALPGVSFVLGLPYTRGREMIDYGLPLCLATDFNPGSSPVNSLQFVMSLAATQMKLTPEESFHAVTVNAAHALRLQDRVGSIGVGKRADFLVMKTENALHKIPYFVGQNQVSKVYVAGKKFD